MAALTGISPPPSRGPPSLRCLGLGGCIIIPLYRSSQCVLPGRTANKLLSLRCCSASCRDCFSVLFSPLQMILMAYCRSCFPFPVVQGKVSLLLDMKFSRFRKGQKKPLHLLMQKHDGFDRMFLKTFSKNFQISFLSIFFSLRNRLFFLICTEFCDIPSSSAISLSVKPSATMWQIWY